MGFAIITPAFPKIVQELNISPQDVGLLISVFAFPGVMLTPVLGVLADRFGRKKILVPSLILFGIAGGACAFARDFNLLLVLRFIQGIGFPSLWFLTTTIIGDIYSGKERTAAMGYNVSVFSIGAAIYPAIGGALAMLGWYYPFILFIIAIPVGLLVLFSLKNPEPRKEPHLKEYLISAWQSIKNRQAVGLFVASTVTFIILLGAYLTFLPLLIGESFGASPFIIGIIISSTFLIAAFTSSQMGKLAKIYSERNLLKASFILCALALFIIPFVSNLWLLLIPTIIFGIAHGINGTSRETLLAGSAPMRHRAAFMSVNQMVLSLGQTLGPLIMGAIFGIWGIGGVFYASAGFSIAMFVFAVIMIR
jgi:MFS family permease